MKIDEFVRLVKAMRAAQRQFYQTRHVDDLKAAKRLEREVDRMLESNPMQGDLFEDK